MTADGPSVIRRRLFDSVFGCLTSSAPNAAKVRQAVQAPSQEAEQPNLVLPGYAKVGSMSCPLDTYPEIHRVTAVVSLADIRWPMTPVPINSSCCGIFPEPSASRLMVVHFTTSCPNRGRPG